MRGEELQRYNFRRQMGWLLLSCRLVNFCSYVQVLQFRLDWIDPWEKGEGGF